MKINFNQHDGSIELAAIPSKGLWGNILVYRDARGIRTGGRAPTEASRQTLLCIALTSGLKAITAGQSKRICQELQVKKPRILIATRDKSFADAVKAIAQRHHAPRLKAGRNFLSELYKQLVRFEISFTQEGDEKLLLSLQNWVAANVVNPRQFGNIPAVFSPVAVSAFL